MGPKPLGHVLSHHLYHPHGSFSFMPPLHTIHFFDRNGICASGAIYRISFGQHFPKGRITGKRK